jgi:hypothetical protein
MAGSLSYNLINLFLMKYIPAAFVLAITLAVANPASAQLKGFGIGPYVEMGMPVSDLKDTHKQGYGAGLFADIRLPGKLSITGSAGYMQFNGKTVAVPEGGVAEISDLKAFPIRAGLKFRPGPLFYLKMESGAANFTGSQSGSALILSPGIGVRILGIDLQAKYEAWVKSGVTNAFWGLRAGVGF